jgi:hypothetical protein
MKLSEFKGDDALEVLANLVEPSVELFKDEELVKLVRNVDTRAKGISYALRNHKAEVFQILAATEGVSVEEYKETCNVMSLPGKILEIFNDEELMHFLSSQVPMEGLKPFGNATEPTKDAEQQIDS